MLISTSWIRDYTELSAPLSAAEILSKITLSVAEVEGVTSVGQHLKKIRVAQILSLKKHPEADKLNLVTFNVGDASPKEVVCGASNVRVGLKIPYAPLGTTLPTGLTLEAKKIRGILSEGMLCSAEELGFAAASDGLLELPENAPIGQTLLDFYQESEDIILDIDNKSLTHRPDLWCHYGFAREFAAVFESKLKNPFSLDWASKLKQQISASGASSPVVPVLQGESSCLTYLGISLDNVTVTDSPSWMQSRLTKCGLRPINNIVDISNYVMLELGIPLHIFDRDLIEGQKIIIKRAGMRAPFTTLDDASHQLEESDTVICDSQKPLVLAGVMGGKNSGVSEKTKNLFIEVANWKAAEVRRTSTRLGLRTDSSMRYEKSLDSQLCERTLLRTLELILKLCPHAQIKGKIETALIAQAHPLTVDISPAYINRRLGTQLSDERIEKIFSTLDFQIKKNSSNWSITVPTYRSTKDIECADDLVEEIGRIVGYDNIQPVSPLGEIAATRFSWTKKLHRKVQDFLVLQARSLEIMTYPLIGEKLLEKAKWPEFNESLQLLNFWSAESDRLRPTLIPSMLEKISLNQKNYSTFRFFELGRSYKMAPAVFCQESNHVMLAFFSKEKSVFIDLLNTVEDLLGHLGVKADFLSSESKTKNPLAPESWAGLHPHENISLRIQGKISGLINTLHPLVSREFKIKGHVSFAIIDLSDLEARELKDKTKYFPLPKFPSSTFDCSVVAQAHESVEKILQPLKKIKLKELVETKILGVFPLEDGRKSVTLRVLFFDPEKTLSGEFLKSAEEQIVGLLTDAGYPLKTAAPRS